MSDGVFSQLDRRMQFQSPHDICTRIIHIFFTLHPVIFMLNYVTFKSKLCKRTGTADAVSFVLCAIGK